MKLFPELDYVGGKHAIDHFSELIFQQVKRIAELDYAVSN